MELSFLQSMLIALAVGLASGSIGAFIILKRMALVGDAFSHVALPGIAIALLYHVDPWWGVVAFLLGAALIVWWIEGRTMLPSEGIVGLLFISSLAAGILLIPNTEIIESLFGEFPSMSSTTLVLFLAAAIGLVFLSYFLARQFSFAIVSEELASVGGVGRGYQLWFLVVFALVVSLGIKLVGTLLMGALTIIPALIAKNITRTMKGYLAVSSVVGAGVSLLGVILAKNYGFLPGPTIVLIGVSGFLLSLFFVRIHSTRKFSQIS